jgi:hypothetical protein
MRDNQMILSQLFCAAYLSVCWAFNSPVQVPERLPESKGSIEGGNSYYNPTLQMKISLPGAWHFFDRTMYSTAESKQREKESTERNRAACQGPLCGDGEIDIALQTDAPFVHAIYLTAYRLSPEYQNRERHPLKRFAEVMGLGGLGEKWVPEGELTAIQLGGRPAYRLIVHHKQTVSAKGFLYVADSNGRVFMLLGTAMSESEKLRRQSRLCFSRTQSIDMARRIRPFELARHETQPRQQRTAREYTDSFSCDKNGRTCIRPGWTTTF